MASLYFMYGTMDAGKTANLLMTAHNYEKQGKKCLLLKPIQDTRSNKVSSRIGISRDATEVNANDNILDIFVKENAIANVSIVLVDEVQFFSVEHIRQMASIVDKYDIPVMTFGLKNSFKDGKVFESITELIYQADNIQELKSMCSHKDCCRKATHHLMISNNRVNKCGSTVCIGDTKEEVTYYKSVCRKHYYEFNSGDLYED